MLASEFLPNVRCGGTAAQDSQSEANEGRYTPLPRTTCSVSFELGAWLLNVAIPNGAPPLWEPTILERDRREVPARIWIQAAQAMLEAAKEAEARDSESLRDALIASGPPPGSVQSLKHHQSKDHPQGHEPQ